MSKKRKALMVFGVLVVAAIPAYFWLFTQSAVPDEGSFSIDLAQVRALAGSMPGDKPKEIRFEPIGHMDVPSTGVVAGSGWSSTSLTFYAYQLAFEGKTGLVDTGMDQKTAEGTHAKDFDAAAFGRVTQAIGAADFVVVTHEHYDHIGGLATLENVAAVMPKVKLTKEQLSVPKKMDPLVFPAKALEGYTPLSYDAVTAIAPGVVLIKAPGHTPGSQIVYVQRADGAEYLFLGDVAWHQQNVDEVRTRARLATLVMGEDRGGVLLQLKELNRIQAAEKNVHLVPGHDAPRIAELVAGGFLKQGFQ